jgi:phosphoglycolate phosphatase
MTYVDLMVFDFDGTLVNSGADIAASVNHTLQSLGMPRKHPEEIMHFIGDGVQKLIERSLGPDSVDRFQEALEIFASHYAEHMLDETYLYDTVMEVIRHFETKRKVIVTNKRMRFTAEIANTFGLTKHFDDMIGADSTQYKKPDARLLYPLMERYNAAPDRTVVIGDGVNDILLARHAGAVSCALLNGLTRREDLLRLNPDFTCENILELKDLFK